MLEINRIVAAIVERDCQGNNPFDPAATFEHVTLTTAAGNLKFTRDDLLAIACSQVVRAIR